jgi:hypothetical protein
MAAAYLGLSARPVGGFVYCVSHLGRAALTEETDGGDLTMDLSDSLGRALRAARSGDLDLLEFELIVARQIDSDEVERVGERLRTMALCVRAHPSYNEPPQAEAV